MKPKHYMPFHFRIFFEATDSQQPDVTLSYLRAICHYWGHKCCKGLENDDETLRMICRCDTARWGRTKSFVFDNKDCFILDHNGLWQQKRAQEEWEKSLAVMERNSNGGKSRMKKMSPKQRTAFAQAGAAARFKAKMQASQQA